MLFVFVLYLFYLIYKCTIIYNIHKIFYQKNSPESKKNCTPFPNVMQCTQIKDVNYI